MEVFSPESTGFLKIDEINYLRNGLHLTFDLDSNRSKIYKVSSGLNLIYYGYIPTLDFAKQLFKNLFKK